MEVDVASEKVGAVTAAYFEASGDKVSVVDLPVTVETCRVFVRYVTEYELEVSVLYVPVAVLIFII